MIITKRREGGNELRRWSYYSTGRMLISRWKGRSERSPRLQEILWSQKSVGIRNGMWGKEKEGSCVYELSKGSGVKKLNLKWGHSARTKNEKEACLSSRFNEGEQKRRSSAKSKMAQMAHIQQPDFTHVLNFWHNIKGGVLKAQRV